MGTLKDHFLSSVSKIDTAHRNIANAAQSYLHSYFFVALIIVNSFAIWCMVSSKCTSGEINGFVGFTFLFMCLSVFVNYVSEYFYSLHKITQCNKLTYWIMSLAEIDEDSAKLVRARLGVLTRAYLSITILVFMMFEGLNIAALFVFFVSLLNNVAV